MKNQIKFKDIVDEIMASPIGGEVAKDDVDGNACVFHCWDGKRYALALTRINDGCKYDPKTGKPVK